MKRRFFRINKYDWKVYVYYLYDCSDKKEIIDKLNYINAPISIFDYSDEILSDCRINTGLIYSNTDDKTSIIVISKTSSKLEFVNTLAHEQYHLVSHIIKYYNVDYNSEEAAYLAGDIAKHMYVVDLF